MFRPSAGSSPWAVDQRIDIGLGQKATATSDHDPEPELMHQLMHPLAAQADPPRDLSLCQQHAM